MKKTILVILSMTAIATSSPLISAQDDAKPDKEKPVKICKSFKQIGTRLTTKKICKSQEEWDDDTEVNKKLIEQHRGTDPLNGG